MGKAAQRSSRKRMAGRLRFVSRGQTPGFKLVSGKNGKPEFKPNRAKARQQLAIKRRLGSAAT